LEDKKVTCVDCGNRLQISSTFYAFVWQRPHPDQTLDDELEHNEDFGPWCGVCCKYRKEQLRQPTSGMHK
jgi:hypothetical protein